MSPEILQILIPAIAAILGSIGTLFVSKGGDKKDITLNDRRSLSEDEKAFRAELRDAISGYKSDLDEARVEIRDLVEEVAKLHKINLELTLENKRLQVKVDDLRRELHRFSGGA